jgi:hypothetical protein
MTPYDDVRFDPPAPVALVTVKSDALGVADGNGAITDFAAKISDGPVSPLAVTRDWQTGHQRQCKDSFAGGVRRQILSTGPVENLIARA